MRHFLDSLGFEDNDTAEQVDQETTTETTQTEPVLNTDEAQDKKVPGTGAVAPGKAGFDVADLQHDNTPAADITTGGTGESEETDRVDENTVEDPDYVNPEQENVTDTETDGQNIEPIDTNTADTTVDENGEVVEGGDTAGETDDAEFNSEDTIIEDVEPEEIEEVTDEEEDEVEEDLDEEEEEAEDDEEEVEDLEEAADEAEDLAESNESWIAVMKHAIKNDSVTVELKAGLEAHLIHMEQRLGEAVHSNIHSLEAYTDDHEMYCQQAVASLEGIADTIERAYERVVNGLSQKYHFVSDALTQKKTYGKLAKLAEAALNRIASSQVTSKSIKTGGQTRQLTMAGNLVSNVAQGVATHVKSMEAIFNDFIPKSVSNIDRIFEAVRACNDGKSWGEMDELVKPLKDIPLASSYLRPEWRTGKAFLGCIALRGEDGHVAQNGSFYRYARSRAKFSQPKWTDLDDVPQRTELTVTKADAQKALKTIHQHCTNMVAGHTKLTGLEKATAKSMSVLSVLLRKLPVVRAVSSISKARRFYNAANRLALAEVGAFIHPSRLAIYRDLRVLRGVIAFLNRF